MNFTNQKFIIKLILAFFIAAISPYADSNLVIEPTSVQAGPLDDISGTNPLVEPTQTPTSDQITSNDTITTSFDTILDEKATPNVTKKFRDWAKEIQKMEDNLNTVVYDEILKVDTLMETERVIELNNEIIAKVKIKIDEINNLKGSATTTIKGSSVQKTYANPDYNSNEDAWAQHIYNHYLEQAQKLKELFDFNQIFECLMIKAEIGAEVNGEMLDHKQFVDKATEAGLIACPPGPNASKSKKSTGSVPAETTLEDNYGGTNEIQNTNIGYLKTEDNFSLNQFLGITKTYAAPVNQTDPGLTTTPPKKINLDNLKPAIQNLDPDDPAVQQVQQEINNTPEPKQGNPPTQESLPPPLEFVNPAEVKILLPQTIDELNAYYHQDLQVDERIYYLLYHVFRTMEKEGETYERYLADKVIQDASTPAPIKLACGKNIEDGPEKCNNVANLCGIVSATYFVFEVATGSVGNIGVPYKDRAHLKIWLGLNSPYESDEVGADEIKVLNPHYDLKAVDISEIGLYNESTDCAACGDMVSCKSITAIVDGLLAPILGPTYAINAAVQNNVPFFNIYRNSAICMLLCTAPILWGSLCKPCCPPILDSANPNTIPVEVKWQNENYGSIASDLAGAALDKALPFDKTNGFSITNMLKGLAQGAIQQLFNSGFKNFDVAKLAQGGFETFMNEMGNQWLDEKVFGKLGLPEGFASGMNWLNPDPQALITSITGNYLDEQLGLEFGSFTPIISAMMSGDFKNAALSSLNLTPNLNLPPKLQEAMNIAIQNGDNPKAMGLAFANIGLKKLNTDLLGWPDGILDLDSFSGEGFIGIANKLGQQGLSKIEGLPTNFIFDIKNPKNTAMSLAGSLMSDVTDNQTINQAITSAISQRQNFSLNSALNLMQTEDLAKIFDVSTENAKLMKDYLNNPTSMPFVSFKNSLLDKIDFNQAALKNTNFTPESLELLFDYGFNSAYSDNNSSTGSLMMSALSNSIKLDKIGINLNKTDIEKLAFMQEYIQISNNLPNQNLTNNSSPFGPGYNPVAFSPELQKLSQDFANRFGTGESIPQFHDRILSTIDQSALDPNSNTAKSINEASYLVPPLKIKFSERINKNELNSIDYLDIVPDDQSNPNPTNTNNISAGDNSPVPTGRFVGVLRSLNIDLNSLEIVHSSVFEKKVNEELSANQSIVDALGNSSALGIMSGGTQPTANPQAVNSDYFEPGEIYYAYPKVDMAEIILPGIRSDENYENEIGSLKLLATSTNIYRYNQEQAIIITPYPTGSTQIQTVINQDPFKKAFLDNFQVSYKQPDNSIQQFDTASFMGGSETIYNTLNSIGKNDSKAEENLSNLGVTMISASMTGIDIAKLFNDQLDTTVLEDKIKQLTNVMGIVKSWQTGDIESGIKSMTGFLKENGVFDKLSENSTWNIGSDGNIIVGGFDPLKIYSDIESGNYQQILEDIPAIQEKFSALEDKLGTSPTKLLDLVQNFSPDKASDTIMDIMADKITSESGLEKLQVAQELTNTLGIPPDPKNIPKLLQSDFFQTKVLKDVDPKLLGDIGDIYGLIADGKITPQKAISTIMTANFFQDAIGKEDFQKFMSNYGGIVNAALTGDPKAIANSILTTPKFADKINNWLTDKGIGDYFDIGSLQGLINGDIKGFIKQTSMKYLQKNLLSKLSGPLGGLMSNSLLSILNGEFPTEAIMTFATDYLIKEFLSADDLLLQSIGDDFTNGLTLNPSTMLIDTLGSFANQAVAGFVFTKCKKKIAQDNIIHLLDMILTFDRNKSAHFKYGITKIDDTGKIVEATDEMGLPIDDPESYNNPVEFVKNYYPLQIFSDLAGTIEDKVASKAKEKFDYIWYEDRFDYLNVFVKKCTDRTNGILINCEDAIHVGF